MIDGSKLEEHVGRFVAPGRYAVLPRRFAISLILRIHFVCRVLSLLIIYDLIQILLDFDPVQEGIENQNYYFPQNQPDPLNSARHLFFYYIK